jgi:hypothetical protein
MLAASDKIAADIRVRAAREVVPPSQRPDLALVSVEGLAFVFKSVFGRSPPDYAIRRAVDAADRLSITSLELLPASLERSEFRDQLAKTYEDIVHIRPGNEDVFLASLHALAKGDKEGLAFMRRLARREWREIDQMATREMLSSLPDTIDELIEQLEDRQEGPDITGWAAAFGATDECAVCGTTIVRPDAFAEAAVQHYGLSDAETAGMEERIQNAIRSSDAEIGGWDTSSLCSYHADQASRDD